LTENEEDAIDRVANGTFCYYENSYLLQHARGRRIFDKQNGQNTTKKSTESSVKYNIHIMEECVVYMPIALGLEKNSPLKPHVDLLVFCETPQNNKLMSFFVKMMSNVKMMLACYTLDNYIVEMISGFKYYGYNVPRNARRKNIFIKIILFIRTYINFLVSSIKSDEMKLIFYYLNLS